MTELRLLRSISELRRWRHSLAQNEQLGLVPTMGALHEGHLSLTRMSQAQNGRTIVTIFVNPTQFAPGEDFALYPRKLEQDCKLLASVGVDAVFAPDAFEIYGTDASTFVVEEQVSLPLCGPWRPGHFRGVATIVLKLLNLVQPTTAYFGQKDAQQCAVIERMVRDLNIPVEIKRGPTLRESDGLAMSSRNAYLTPDQRKKAVLVFESLQIAARLFQLGLRDGKQIAAKASALLREDPAFVLQYWEICHPTTLSPISEIGSDGALCAVAAVLGKTRLIDNWILA